VRKADNLLTFCAVVTKSGKLNFLEPSGLLQACNGTVLHLTLLKLLGLGSIRKEFYHTITVIRFLEGCSDVCWVNSNAGPLPQHKCFDLVRYFFRVPPRPPMFKIFWTRGEITLPSRDTHVGQTPANIM